MKNKFVTFSLILCVVGIFVLFNYPQKAHAIIYFYETWDTGTPASCWPCKSYPCTTSFNGWLSADYNSGWGTMPNCGRSSTRAHSGTYSYYQYRASGAPQTCDIVHQFTAPYPTTIHLRFYLYLTPNWNNYGSLEVVHWIMTNSVLAGNSFRMNFMGDGQYNCGNGGIHMIPEGDGNSVWWWNDSNWDVCGVNYKELIGAWHSIEYRMEISGNNIIFTEWIDGVLRRGPTTGPGQDSTNNFNKITITGWENTSIAHVGDFYIDDIVVSDSYIGSGSGDTQSPSVPTGLSAQVFSSSQINLSWTASTDNVAVTGYRVYRNGTQIDTSPTNSYSNTGLSASTTYTYSVSAYDAVNNVSAQSASASATTAADTGGNTGGGGDASASGGSGCGFVKDINGKGQKANGEGLSLIIMLIIALTGIALARRRTGNITATKEGVLVMKIRRISLIKIAAISFLLTIFWSASAYAQPNITGFSGSLTDGSNITINGNSFGANGPNIVVFDNFESGTNGSNIKIGAGSATIGKWDRIGGGTDACMPKYDNTLTSVSGSMAYKADYTIQADSGTDARCSAFVNNINTGDAFLSYWVYMPTTSAFPCYNGGICNWKPTWLYGTNTTDDDQILPRGLFGDINGSSWQDWGITGNDTASGDTNFTFNMNKGKWYRFWAWIHATPDASGHKDLWVMSKDDSIPVTKKVDWTGQIFYLAGDSFENFMISAWARWCNNCTESAPRFDDVYLATGPNARARIEIGNSATYNTCTNLTIATVTSWSDTSITATVRQGSFGNLNNAYLYVIDANGSVNTNGYLLSDGGGGGNTPPPSSSSDSSGGDSSSGGSGCGFVKDENGKGQRANGEGLSFILMLIITLCLLPIARRLFKAFNRPVL